MMLKCINANDAPILRKGAIYLGYYQDDYRLSSIKGYRIPKLDKIHCYIPFYKWRFTQVKLSNNIKIL
jgi:hypothetical protein